jgi:hypothetical protein
MEKIYKVIGTQLTRTDVDWCSARSLHDCVFAQNLGQTKVCDLDIRIVNLTLQQQVRRLI